MLQIKRYVWLILCCNSAFAAPPAWQITAANFQHSMVIVALLKVDGMLSNDSNDILGVFVGTEVRGVARPSVLADGQLLVFLQVYSNQSSGETLTFKIYNASSDSEITAINTLTFQADMPIGSVATPYFVTDNYGPTDIHLSSLTIEENQAANTSIGTLSATDQDLGDSFTFTLVSGTGATDNAAFVIRTNELFSRNMFDFETQSSYSMRLRATDSQGEFIEEVFTISIIDVNDAPTQIVLSKTNADENIVLGTEVARLSVDDPDVNATNYIYALVDGAGSDDNTSFTIDENSLRSSTHIDFEAKNNYSIRLRATDSDGLRREEVITLTVNDTNDAPTGLTIEEVFVNERLSSSTEITELTVLDQDASDTHTFTLRNHSTRFGINNSHELVLLTTLDYESQALYFLDIGITDQAAATYTARLTVHITDANDLPASILFLPEIIDENAARGTLAGTLSTQDDDAESTYIYTFIAGSGDTDNNTFIINEDQILTNTTLDYESQNRFSFRVRSTEEGTSNYIEEIYSINILNVNEAPAALTLSAQTIEENQLPGTLVGECVVADPDLRDTHKFYLSAGSGSAHNNLFLITDTRLVSREILDFETTNTLNIRIAVVDQAGLVYEETFVITVQNTVETTPNLALSGYIVNEGAASGTEIGVLSVVNTSVLSGTVNYNIMGGTGDGYFRVDGARILLDQVLDFETQAFYSIMVQATDPSTNALSEEFVIVVNDQGDAPTDIILSGTEIDEHTAADVPVATLFTIDEDAEDSFQYALVAGDGADDNTAFVISATNQLRTRVNTYNYEVKDTYRIRLSTTDSDNTVFEKTFTIQLRDINEAPANIALRLENLAENQPEGTLVGTLSTQDPDPSDRFRYALVIGAGDTNNEDIFISGNEIFTASILDAETTSALSVRIRTIDQGDLSFERMFSIPIQDVDDPHTNLQLSSATIVENQPVGTVVGTFSVDDADNSAITYTILQSSLADAFDIVNNQLVSQRVFNFESENRFTILTEARDNAGYKIEQTFRIEVINADDPPTGIELSRQSIAENNAVNDVVGAFSLTDDDDSLVPQAFTYELVSGLGSTDNEDFKIDGQNLVANTVFNYEEQAIRSIRIRVMNAVGLGLTRSFLISIIDLNDLPTAVLLSQTSLTENAPTGTLIAITSTEDQDATDQFSYQLLGDVRDIDLFNMVGDRLYSNAVFNYEAKRSYAISIQVLDRSGARTTSNFTIEIQDANDPPVLLPKTLSVPENAQVDAPITNISASDEDENQQITYNFFLSSSDLIRDYEHYTLNSATGHLTVKDPTDIDYEQRPVHEIIILATDNGTPPQSDTMRYEIDIQDVAENNLPASLFISPNNDGMNDYWMIDNVELYQDMSLVIFNSLGKVVFQTINYQNNWNGTYEDHTLPRGVYHYIFKDLNEQVQYRGTISIL